MSNQNQILIVAGEASADIHGANLVREIRKLRPAAHFFGIGGEGLKSEGVEILFSASTINVVGLPSIFGKLGEILHIFKSLKSHIKQRKPDIAVLLDLPDFNLRLAKFLKKEGIRVAYYISPQVWAWRKSRVKFIKRYIDEMLVVFPFEKEFYEKKGVPVQFVGHPLLDEIVPRLGYRKQNSVQSAPRIAVLPGSRSSEIKYHAELLSETVLKLKERFPKTEIRLPVPPTLEIEFVKKAFQRVAQLISIESDGSREILTWADFAIIASGTATLESALIGTPFCLFYRSSGPIAWVFRNVIRYRGFLGMPNLLQGQEVAKEFFQSKATPEALFEDGCRLIGDDKKRLESAQKLLDCRLLLGSPGASARAAQRINQMITGFKAPEINSEESLPLVPQTT